MQSFSDEQLMEIFQCDKEGQGQIALDFLYKRYARPMLTFFYHTLRNDYGKAQDFVHDLFLKIIENGDRFDQSQVFRAWIYRIASNMCKNEFRSRQVQQKYKSHVASTYNQVSTINEQEELLRKCLNSLNQEHRSLLVLRFKMKLSVKEIAGIYECPDGTIKSRLFYATKELSKIYKK